MQLTGFSTSVMIQRMSFELMDMKSCCSHVVLSFGANYNELSADGGINRCSVWSLTGFFIQLVMNKPVIKRLIQLTTFLLGDKYGLVALWVFLFLSLFYALSLMDLSHGWNEGLLQVQRLSFEAVTYLVIAWYLFSVHGGPPFPF